MERKERTQAKFRNYLQSLYYQTISDPRARFNEAVFLVFSHPLFTSPQMPLLFFFPLLLSPFLSSSLCSVFTLFLCVYLPFSYLFTFVSSLTALSFPFVSSRFPSAFVALSPRWITAQRTAPQTQVRIMNLPRERCCSSQERPSKVKIPTYTY